ncbi:ADP-ribosylglycohydrolase family protein [Candidatus Woesearchaeota archaeon]|jgi:ADP-ribosyl-[dinitrogen reductase] hydrolase|nr:ADP-ribosylglycohydrolase family protein [Candidatus Woesearchaeota archaeon]MBT5397022.1 ADP-ribosylglycohydrolase family protein [Candidatus Woesearchaeota archaeon]MBT5924555.1 ADP-ribosylglycohydrolase family protein [Candidatus Woesearchaeota archaeon]MBT6367432.1 ADP-ribosylglycohydrolase family protein [Candidatus Woesearchaeota archaeon]MBT7762422.1 ADP-ribosylglycohydrolase family protein [Candidatus Woesearchaeota archaeon]
MVDTNKFVGCIVGAACGDALGMPTEYISQRELNELYGGCVSNFLAPSIHHPCSHLNPGQFTDDTQQLLLLAESLLESDGLDIVNFGQKMGEWAFRCYHEPGYNRFAGGTSLRSSMRIYDGEIPGTTGRDSPTCGAAMRIAPIGLFYHNDTEKLDNAAEACSAVTHTHPACVEGGKIIARMVSTGINDQDPFQSLQDLTDNSTTSLKDRLQYVLDNVTVSPKDVGRYMGMSESIFETIPMALHCFLHSPNSFERTLIEAANLVPGDTDSIACIAGAMSGARNGLHSIPSRFRDKIEDKEHLESIAVRIHQKVTE